MSMEVNNYPYPIVQREFIEKVRAQVDVDESFFFFHDWRCINPPNGKYSSLLKSVYAESFYVRPVAVWLPDRLLPNFTPTCPNCQSKRFVNLNRARWQNSPKVLFGLKGYWYLDSKLYPCTKCQRHFSGYNPDSMKHDSDQYMGYFNFHFSGRFAVDEELHSYICSNYDTPTPKIQRTLQQMAVDTYLNDYQLYLHAVRSKRIKMQRRNVTRYDPRQQTLHTSLDDAPVQLTANERTVRGLRNSLRATRLAHSLALGKLQERVCFKTLRKIKRSRNGTDLVLTGVGVKKLDELMAVGIMDARDLVEYVGVPGRWSGNLEQTRPFEKTRAKAVRVFSDRQVEANRLANRVQELEEELSEAEEAVHLTRIVTEQMAAEGEVEEEPATLPPLFSSMLDQNGYCARVLSKDQIECILMTDFLHHKPVQQSKMLGLSAEVIKIDFEYKIVKKIHVYNGVGKAFRPYKCLATVQNENNQTVYYKVCQGSEAIDEISTGLTHLRDRNSKAVRVICVDNCCSVRAKLLAIFIGAVVKLDPFHWMKRWDAVLFDPTSQEAAIFRGLLRRAMFLVDTEEYKRAKKEVTEKLLRAKKILPGMEPARRLILQEARTVIPPKGALEENIQAVLRYCYSIDFRIEMKKALRDPEDTSELPKPFFKPLSKIVEQKSRRTVSNVFASQIGHIKDDCLSDPPGVVLHRMNPRTKKIYCCRGTPSNENDNLYIDGLTGKALGIGRANMLMSTYFEVSNDRKRWNRIGEATEDCLFSHRTEQFGMVNSLYCSAGYDETALPFLVCQPALPDDIQASDMGFDQSHVEDIFAAVENNNEQESAFVEDENGLEAENNDLSDDEETALDFDGNGDEEQVDRRLDWLIPEIRRKESTMDAFKRLTMQHPWIPFHSGNGPRHPVDEEESQLFESMKERFNQRAAPQSRTGYYAFMTAWNLEVAARYKRQAEGEENVIIINRKSIQQLQEHWDSVEARLGMSVRVEEQWALNGAGHMTELNNTLRENQHRQGTLPPVQVAESVEYRQAGPRPLGVPAVINPEIVAGSIRPTTQQNLLQTVPYNVPPPRRNQELNPLAGWKRKMWCITCGYRRQAHVRDEQFGKHCRKEWCGKCYQRKEFHEQREMGPLCPNPPHPTESQHLFWYA